MYKRRYIQYLNLPTIPQEIVDTIIQNPEVHRKATNQVKHGDFYIWSDYNNQSLNAWCQENICAEMYFAFQMMNKDVPIHKDNITKTKLSYLVDTGGNNVITSFYDDNHILLDSYCIEPNRWHILKADTCHAVDNISNVRFSITSRIFE